MGRGLDERMNRQEGSGVGSLQNRRVNSWEGGCEGKQGRGCLAVQPKAPANNGMHATPSGFSLLLQWPP